MKKILTSILFFYLCSVYSQNNNSFTTGLNKGWNDTLLEEKNIDLTTAGYPEANKCNSIPNYSINEKNVNEKEYSRGYRCGVEQAVKIIPILQQKSKEKAIKEAELKSIAYNKQIEDAKKNNFSGLENYKESKNEVNSYSNYNVNNDMMNYYNQQQQMQQQYNNNIQNQINSMSVGLSNQLQAMAIQNLQKELTRRQNVANNFINLHSNSLKGLIEQYQSIPKENFNIVLNGKYSASLIENNSYSFVNNNKIKTVTSVLAEFKDNVLINVYRYGIEAMKNDFIVTNNNFKIENGVVKLSMENSIVVIEPYYLNNVDRTYSFYENVGYINLWTDNKSEVGKTVYVQQLDKNGNIIREFQTPLLFSKNKKTLETDITNKIPVLPDYEFLFFGEPTQTNIGLMPLHLKVNKNDYSAIKNQEHKYVEIKKYRE